MNVSSYEIKHSTIKQSPGVFGAEPRLVFVAIYEHEGNIRAANRGAKHKHRLSRSLHYAPYGASPPSLCTVWTLNTTLHFMNEQRSALTGDGKKNERKPGGTL